MPLLLGNTASSGAGLVPAGYVTNNLVFFVDGNYSASYPGSGSTWYDLSGKQNHLTLSGATWVGSYFNFSGGVDGPDAITPNFSADFDMHLVDWTLNWCVFGDSTMNSDTVYHDMISVGYVSTGEAYSANIWRSGLQPGKMYSTFGNETSFGSGGYVDGGSYSPRNYTGQVTYATVTRSGNTMSYYINGTLQTTYTLNWQGSYAEPPAGNGKMWLGCRNIGNHGFIGSFYHASFYRGKALNSTEVTQNWNMIRTRFGL